MNKKLWILIWSAIVWATTIAAPMITTAAWFLNQNSAWIWVAWWSVTWQGNNGLVMFVQHAINVILTFLSLITIAILIWGGFQMVTAAGDDGKYKKWFTIVKQAVIWLILIWSAALIVNAVFYFMWQTATPSWNWTSAGATTTP